MGAQRRSAACAVRDALVVLIEQPFFPELLENPPDTLDVLVFEGDIGVIQADPIAHALGQFFPIIEIAQHALATFFVVFSDAIDFDLALNLDAEFLLDLDLDGQAMRIPTAFAQHTVTIHHLIAREQIFERPRQNMMDTGLAVGSWRPFIENIVRLTFALTERALENLLLAPKVKLLFL